MVLEDLFILLLHFFTRPPPVHPYFCPSIFVFTRPNDGWTGLYIKLWWCGVVWCGVVWCGVVRCGVWCGVVWCGLAVNENILSCRAVFFSRSLQV